MRRSGQQRVSSILVSCKFLCVNLMYRRRQQPYSPRSSKSASAWLPSKESEAPSIRAQWRRIPHLEPHERGPSLGEVRTLFCALIFARVAAAAAAALGLQMQIVEEAGWLGIVFMLHKRGGVHECR